MKVTVGQITDKGLNPKRATNEDNLFALPEVGLFLVADGVGGRLGGEVASQTVVDVFSRVFSQPQNEELRTLIANTIDLCNQKIHEDAHSNPDLDGMATTVALVAVSGTRAIVAHVGDSRVYRYDTHGLICLTEDHSEVGEALRAGTITPEQAAMHPRRNVISRAIGAEPEVEPDFREIEIDEETSFLLCTDGITRHITDAEISRLMRGGERPQALCEKMKALCYQGGAEDNLTAIVVDFSEYRYVAPHSEDATRPRMAAVQTTILPEAPVVASNAKIELDLKAQAQSGLLRKAPSQAAAEPVAASAQASDGHAGIDSSTTAVRKKPSLGKREVTIKLPLPTVKMPPKEEMSLAMRMSLLGAAALAGLLLGMFVSGPINRLLGSRFSGTDPYLLKNTIRKPVDADVASAFALHLEGRSNEARTRLNELLVSNPRNAEAHLFLGRIDFDQKGYQEAISHMSEATRIDPDLQDVWINLAQAYLAIGQTRNAQDCLARALKSGAVAPAAPVPESVPSVRPEGKPTPLG
jgi:serine/threonine protein phosphatase PrpC